MHILFAGGGTAGHINPALAIAGYIREKTGRINTRHMELLVQIIILLIGLSLILFGANYLVDGASSIAKKFGLSEFVIGLTIVGIGTSAPEMVVSFLSSL